MTLRPRTFVGYATAVLAVLTLLLPTGATAAPSAAGASGTLLRPNVGLYPRAIRLAHSGGANGTIVASVVTFDGNNGQGAIYASHDDGRSFTQVGTVADPASAGGKGLCCASIYELPRPVGALPAGTLLWASDAGQDSGADRRMSIRVWQSRDHGHTWSLLATPVVAPNALGLWEPELTVAEDGRLVVYYSDETDQPNHSQMLDMSTSTDGIHWSDPARVVASADPAARPGMAVVRRIADGGYLMTYEVCGGGYACRVHYRTSPDGVQWGDPADLGPQIAAADGSYFVHTPTTASTPNGGGTLYLVGQILDNPDGTVAAGNGATVFVSDDGPAGPWRAVDAPVHVPDPYDNYCPNYSSTLLPTDGGRDLLEIATAYDTDGVCKAYYATSRP